MLPDMICTMLKLPEWTQDQAFRS